MTDADHDIETPDAFDPSLECRAWVKAPRIIGGPSHTHVCRRAFGHLDTDDVEQQFHHECTCGHRW